MLKYVISFLAAPILVAVPLAIVYLRVKRGGSAKKSLTANMALFFSTIAVCTVVFLTQGASAASEAVSGISGDALATAAGYFSAAISVSVSGIASAKAVSSSACAAIGAVAENDSTFGKSIVFVGMAEGIALYGMLIAFMIIGQLG